MLEQETRHKIEYFLGANTGRGFFSHYAELIDQRQARAFYVIKGGPGSGKSTLMRLVAQRLTEAGHDAEFIRCSGDPDSLDGVLFPGIRCAVADGTHPHVTEPEFCGLTGAYIDLSHACDPRKLSGEKERIMELYGLYRAAHIRAQRYILAADQVTSDLPNAVLTEELCRSVRRRAAGIAAREFPKTAAKGTKKLRFLSAVTCAGTVTLWRSVEAQASRVFAISDRYHISHIMLDELQKRALDCGHDLISCVSPRAPERIEQLIIPGLSLAFVSCRGEMQYTAQAERRIRLDLTAEKQLTREMKARIRFSERLERGLMAEATSALAQAKQKHDELEALYNPAIDFDAVRAAADTCAERLLSLCANGVD